MSAFRVAGHLLLGRRYLWQYYTNVTWRTCEECLSWHGRIAARPERFPRSGDGCERKLLRFPVWQLSYYREKSRLMREIAQRELERRALWRKAVSLLPERPGEALELFERAGAVDLFIPELEGLVQEHRDLLEQDPELSIRLREVFLRRWLEKFGKPRYERLPERMRIARERWGERRIKELFPAG